jgi:hypothetical protein
VAVLVTPAVLCWVVATATAETVQRGELRVELSGKIAPSLLPRHALAPVDVTVATKISSTTGPAPQLQKMSIAINRFGRLDAGGLPLCGLEEIQPATNETALQSCGDALVGEGSFTADVMVPGQSPFPSRGKLYAFNGRVHGKLAILAHVYGELPGPTSYTFPFVVSRAGGAFGLVLKTIFPQVQEAGGRITGLSLTLGRTYFAKGHKHHYLSASCPLPDDVSVASFPFAKATLSFTGGQQVSSTLRRSCRVRP